MYRLPCPMHILTLSLPGNSLDVALLLLLSLIIFEMHLLICSLVQIAG